MMIQKFLHSVVFVCLLTAMQFVAFAQVPATESPLPAPAGFVNDYAGVIDAATKERLEARLKKLKGTTNPPIEIAVAVVRSTNGADPFDYSLKVARGWKIGGKEQDNPSILLLVSIDDRKYFTQISRDLEGDLTDSESKQIELQNLVPAFRQQQYGKGIEDTINGFVTNIAETRGFDASQITGQIEQSRRTQPRQRAPQRVQSSLGTCCLILAVLFVLLFLFSSRGRGGRGGGGGGLLDGLLLGMFLNSATSGNSWNGGSFGGSGGGDWGGNSSDGGFGGFGGGGDFGGGGSGGDW